jgi:site-specific DNA recombinase
MIRRPEVEQRVLRALQDKLTRKDFFEEFCREFAKEMNRLRMEQHAGLSSAKRDLERVKRDIRKVIDAIKAGYAGPELKAEMDDLQARKNALLAQLATADERPPLLHPSIADLYRSKVEELASSLQREDTRLEASEMLRGLIDSIVLTPEKGQLRIELRGNLAAMLTAAQQTKRSPDTGDLSCRFNWLRGHATIWIWSSPGRQPDP